MSTATAAEIETTPSSEWMNGAHAAQRIVTAQVFAGQTPEQIEGKWAEAKHRVRRRHRDSRSARLARRRHAYRRGTDRDVPHRPRSRCRGSDPRPPAPGLRPS